MWNFFRIDLCYVFTQVDRLKFSESEIDNLANLIVEMKGLIRPAILKQISSERYEVINGHLEYYASLIAHQKDRRIETINAFVISEDAENIAFRQIQSLIPSDKSPKPDPDIVGYFHDFKRSMEKQFKEFQEEQHKDIQTLTKKVEYLIDPPKSPVLVALNNCDINQLIKGGFTKKNATEFLEKRAQKPFDSLGDIKNRVTGVAGEKIIKLIDYLSQL